MQFVKKIQEEEKRICVQIAQREKQRGCRSSTETAPNVMLRQVIVALASEFQECMLKQQANVETAYTKLELLRDLSDIQTQQAKMLFCGSQCCFENYETASYYGSSGISHSTGKAIDHSVMPLLKSMVQMLEEDSRSYVSSETPETASSSQSKQDAFSSQEGELIVVDSAALSTREFVTYQYGISLLQFLSLHIDAPEVKLCVASSIPLCSAAGSAFRNSFFYQTSKNKLFILRDCLGSVGSFLLLLVHCFAHIAAADFSQDTNPTFLRLFHQALKTCLGEMFSLRLQLSAVLQGNKSLGITQMLLKEEPFSKEERSLISQLFEVKGKNFTEIEAFEKIIKQTESWSG
ncbi:uncharacterized protein LOC122186106 isoform X2 [Lagopus leucura]|nr:uncharacterized protein LOC122186106 isoform X2 [Lagopus leucura]